MQNAHGSHAQASTHNAVQLYYTLHVLLPANAVTCKRSVKHVYTIQS